jgi:glycerophosphoryl diester phosphodiesterase
MIAYAHRGGADGAPENTMRAFERAVSLGYRFFETDVHVTRDGVVVAFHDDRLERVTDGRGRIIDLTYAEVQQADAGWWYTLDGGATHPFRGRGVTVPALADILERWPDVHVNIDAKADHTVVPLMALLDRLDAFSRVCLASFSDRRLARMRHQARGAVVSSMGRVAASSAYAWSRLGRMPRLNASRVQVPMRAGVLRLDRRFVDAAHRAGLAVDVWTVNSEHEIRDALGLGVDGIMSDRLDLLKRMLVDRGEWDNGAAMTTWRPQER